MIAYLFKKGVRKITPYARGDPEARSEKKWIPGLPPGMTKRFRGDDNSCGANDIITSMAAKEREIKARLKKLEKHPNRIKRASKPRTMPVAEWEFARCLLQKNPGLIVISHPQKFRFTDRAGNQRETTPDFLIVNPNNSATNIYVEITLFEKDKLAANSKKDKKRISLASRNGFDTKARQREVMENAAPDERYVVLYAHNLKNMQRSNPNFKPFGTN